MKSFFYFCASLAMLMVTLYLLAAAFVAAGISFALFK